MPALEQPAVNLLALELAGFDDLAELGVGVVDQVANQPQVQWVNLGDEALVGQVIGARAIAVVEPFQAFVGETFLGLGGFQVGAHEAVETLLGGFGQ
ncbi:hypothetical protein D3C80_1666840 [compost metagenome]